MKKKMLLACINKTAIATFLFLCITTLSCATTKKHEIKVAGSDLICFFLFFPPHLANPENGPPNPRVYNFFYFYALLVTDVFATAVSVLQETRSCAY